MGHSPRVPPESLAKRKGICENSQIQQAPLLAAPTLPLQEHGNTPLNEVDIELLEKSEKVGQHKHHMSDEIKYPRQSALSTTWLPWTWRGPTPCITYGCVATSQRTQKTV